MIVPAEADLVRDFPPRPRDPHAPASHSLLWSVKCRRLFRLSKLERQSPPPRKKTGTRHSEEGPSYLHAQAHPEPSRLTVRTGRPWPATAGRSLLETQGDSHVGDPHQPAQSPRHQLFPAGRRGTR